MKTIEVARRKERGSLFHCLNHHRQSEVAGGHIIALPPLGSLGIPMPSVPAIYDRDESLHHVSILPQVFLS